MPATPSSQILSHFCVNEVFLNRSTNLSSVSRCISALAKLLLKDVLVMVSQRNLFGYFFNDILPQGSKPSLWYVYNIKCRDKVDDATVTGSCLPMCF